jgi:hypothetical protein
MGGIQATIPIKVVRATESESKLWHSKVHPFIKRDAENRLDVKWDWHKLVKESSVFHRAQKALKRRSFATFAILACIKDVETPVAMLHLASPYPWVANSDISAVFVWYLASAPQSYLQKELGFNARLLEPMIDSALVFSWLNQLDGRISLHADPRGRKDLENRYERVGLIRLEDNVTLPAARRAMKAVQDLFGNDEDGGAYFYSTVDTFNSIVGQSTSARVLQEGQNDAQQ